MWIADNWKDYEVIDCSQGEKLERWADYILIRPDPQVIWDTPKAQPGWNKKHGHYHRSKKGGGEWEFWNLPQQWDIQYKPHLPPKAVQLQAYRPVSGTSRELGLVQQQDTSGQPPH